MRLVKSFALHRSRGSGHNTAMRGLHDDLTTDAAVSTMSASRPGTITVLCGCMFSGKTTELLRRLARYSPRTALVFKHVIDNRYASNAVVSHDGKMHPAIQISAARQLTKHLVPETVVVGVDEAHFFDPDIVAVTRELAEGGIDVILTSLDRDSWGRPFRTAERLCSMAHKSITEQAVCARCGGVADRTQRVTPIVGGNMVGGPESYEPRCQKCWMPPREPPPGGTSS